MGFINQLITGGYHYVAGSLRYIYHRSAMNRSTTSATRKKAKEAPYLQCQCRKSSIRAN